MAKLQWFEAVLAQLSHWDQDRTAMQRWTVALSGGVDSVVMLHLAKRYRELARQHGRSIELQAVHVNHQLSSQAPHWQQFCVQLCQQWQIPLQVFTVTVARGPRLSLEQQARTARYQAISQALTEQQAVTDHRMPRLLLGHHADDQLETTLLQLQRGAGAHSLAGMSEHNLHSGLQLFRPLLRVSRAEIEQYAAAHQLLHITDDSNADAKILRNAWRNQLLPTIKQLQPQFARGVQASQQLLQMQAAVLDEVADSDLAQCVSEQRLALVLLRSLSVARAGNMLRRWFDSVTRLHYGKAALVEMIRQLQSLNDPDNQMRFELGEYVLLRHQDFAYLVADQQLLPTLVANPLLLSHSLSHPLAVRAPRSDEQVSIRYGAKGVWLKPKHKPRNKLNHWFKDAGIPVWLRDVWPLVFYNDELIAVPGVMVSEAAALDPAPTQNGAVVWQCAVDNHACRWFYRQ